MDRIGVGIIGCGNISEAYLRLAPMFAGIKVHAVADIDAAAAERRSSEFGVQALSTEELLASDQVDIVCQSHGAGCAPSVSRRILEPESMSTPKSR